MRVLIPNPPPSQMVAECADLCLLGVRDFPTWAVLVKGVSDMGSLGVGDFPTFIYIHVPSPFCRIPFCLSQCAESILPNPVQIADSHFAENFEKLIKHI